MHKCKEINPIKLKYSCVDKKKINKEAANFAFFIIEKIDQREYILNMKRYVFHFRTSVHFPFLRKGTDIAAHAYHIRRKKKFIYHRYISMATKYDLAGFAWSSWVQEER